MKFEIHKFKSVTSTNDVAINLIKKKRMLFGCVYADIQTRGRGTNGKSWISKKPATKSHHRIDRIRIKYQQLLRYPPPTTKD